MKYRALAMFALVIIFGLLTNHAFAQNGKSSCDLYSRGSFMTGMFKQSENVNRFERNGISLGFGCYSGPNSKFSLGIGAEAYFGNLNFKHEETSLKGSFSYFEKGFKEWVRASVYESPVRISLGVGVQKTVSSGFNLNSVHVNLWDTWYDFTKFGHEHLTSDGKLEVWEAELNFQFLVHGNFYLTLGTQWQKYKVLARMDFDAESKKIFDFLQYDVSKLEQGFNESVNFFYFTPGAKWCGKKLCASLVVPYGLFISKAGSWGGSLEIGTRF